MKNICSKTYIDFPFAHRQPNHKGHCALIHGHNWSFTFVFGAVHLDENGFVVDFGDLKWLKTWLTTMFDHTLVFNNNDPCLERLTEDLTGHGTLADIRTVPNCGAEGLANFIHKRVSREIQERYGRRVTLVSVTVHEDSKNEATYTP